MAKTMHNIKTPIYLPVLFSQQLPKTINWSKVDPKQFDYTYIKKCYIKANKFKDKTLWKI
jgi:hypothetical protein